MNRTLRRSLLAGLLLIVVTVAFAYAAAISERPRGVATPYWYGFSAGAPSSYYLAHPTLSANDTAAGIAATQTLSNKTLASPAITGAITGTGVIDATNITNIERSFELPLVAAFLDGTGVIGNDGTTAPGLAETDNIPAIVYASSGESTKLQWTFRLPSDYVSGMGFRALMSSSAATSTGQSIDWQLWVNDDDTTFDAAAVAQDAGAPTSATLNASNEVVTLNIDATGETALSAGSLVTVDVWNAGTSDNTTEIKGLQCFYTATQ
jgi:hypothetical protein